MLTPSRKPVPSTTSGTGHSGTCCPQEMARRVRSLRLTLLATVLIALTIIVYFALLPTRRLCSFLNCERLKISDNGLSTALRWSPQDTAKTEDLLVVRIADAADPGSLVELASQMYRQHGTVLFVMINDAYFDFAASWCCNTAPLRVHQHVLFLTTDLHTGQRLKALWPNVTVAALSTPQFSGFRNYSKVGHVRMMTERTRFILRLLEAEVQVLLFEVDCLWLKDPLPLVRSHQFRGDIVGTRVGGKDVTAAGFLLLNPTAATLKFWRQLTQDLDELVSTLKAQRNTVAVAGTKNEQEYFTSLARRKFAGIRIDYLSEDLFPDGKWYRWPEKRRRESQPVLINNNWVVGHEGKRQRARAFGHWFWDEAEGKCNASAVRRIFP